MVLYCISNNKALDELTPEEFKGFSPKIEDDVYEAISLEKCVSDRRLPGGPAPESVKAAIENGRKFLQEAR
jgi:argininosuccinate lyase